MSGLVPWKIIKPTALSHTIVIPVSAAMNLEIEQGSFVGTYDEYERCFSLFAWHGENSSIILFGDDSNTHEKDGNNINTYLVKQ